MASTTKPSRRPHRQLGYGIPGGERDLAFKKAIAEQVRTFVSSTDNLPAFKLTKWKNRVHQRGLLEVTNDFLEVKGKGTEFWPYWKTDLNYQRDTVKIRCLMTKVFWSTACEKKRKRSTTSPGVHLSQTSRDALHQPVKTEESSSVTEFPNEPSQFDDRGNTVDNPIDIENMTSNSSMPGPSTDNDPWANHNISFRRANEGSENHVTDAFMPISSDIPDFTNWHDSTSTRASLPAGGNIGPAVDPYDGPDSPPRVAQNRQESSKRPVEPDSNNNRPLKTHKPNLSKGKEVASSTTITKSGRTVRQRSFPDRSTDEQLEAAVGSSSSSASQEGSYANRCQQRQAKDSTNGSTSATPLHPETSRSRTSQSTPRAQAARWAAEQAERAAGEVQTTAMGPASSSAVAQQERPDMVHDTTSLPQARSSESQEQARISEMNRIASAVRTDTEISQVPLPAPRNQMRPNQLQRMALKASLITYRSSISHNGTIHSVLTFEPSVFQISLNDVVRALNLNNDFGTFYIVFDTIEEGVYPYMVNDEDDFETFRVECLAMITSYYQRSQLIPEAERQSKRYRVLFSRTNNTA
ncbi:hypothetical protein FIE12Z_8616 [Fusarium flagelliforme]|uniref:Uncharacterized protein n=1 Tax=Fusarium flagelliforme TaxID=2675880 RepID=A0A395MGW6_9HYPO|nr:hypothetical protein FIE12Z_8616 [Fusarium flagelliforme]